MTAAAAAAVYGPWFADDAVTVWAEDCLQVLGFDDFGYDWSLGYRPRRLIPDASVDAVVTDPPYGIGFMDKAWDQPGRFGSHRRNGTPGVHRRGPGRDITQIRRGAMEAGTYNLSPAALVSFQSWCTEWASECLRVLKPGGHLVAFGGSRTWHRLACAVEDAGFEVRDSIAWLYGSGFPKSLDVSKAIDKAAGAQRVVLATGRESVPTNTAPATAEAARWQGWGTALKPAFEPIVVARKPLAGSVAHNVQAHGTGALNIDGCRTPTGEVNPSIARRGGPANRPQRRGAAASQAAGRIESRTTQERFSEPRVGETIGRWPTSVALEESQAADLDRQAGTRKSGANPARRSSDKFRAVYGEFTGQSECVAHRGAEQGGASRFFPVFRYSAKADRSQRPTATGIAHPTVKPLELMRWLVRLAPPPHGVVLDPFAGTGTTAVSLNPSRRDMDFAKRFGYDAVTLLNLDAVVMTDPKHIAQVADSVGPDNDAHLDRQAALHDVIVFAWGANADPARAGAVATRLWNVCRQTGGSVACWTANSQPRHLSRLAKAILLSTLTAVAHPDFVDVDPRWIQMLADTDFLDRDLHEKAALLSNRTIRRSASRMVEWPTTRPLFSSGGAVADPRQGARIRRLPLMREST